MSLQVFVEINRDRDHKAAEKHEEDVAALTRSRLGDVQGVAIDDMAIRAQANLDPAAVASLAVLLSSIAGAVGAGTAVLIALRKMVTEGGALIRAIEIEIDGKPRPLASATAEEIEKELNTPASN
jgi:hypothetical protein